MKIFNFLRRRPKLVFGTVTTITASTLYFNYWHNKIDLIYKDTENNKNIIETISQLRTRSYVSSGLLPLGTLEILFGNVFEPSQKFEYKREIIFTPDNENLALDWGTFAKNSDDSHSQKAVVILIPGLTGSSQANYIKPTAAKLQKQGFQTVVVNPRGVEIPQISTSLFDFRKMKEDLLFSVHHVKEKFPGLRLYFMGFSYGACYGTTFMAEHPDLINGMVSVGNPFNIVKAIKNLETVQNILYR
jgi:predicted alpha/beta-fold hydrolase